MDGRQENRSDEIGHAEGTSAVASPPVPPAVLDDGFDPRHVSLDTDETLWPPERTEAVRKVRGAARQDLRKLLAMSPRGRKARIEEAESRRSFRSRALAEMLVRESRERRRHDPAEGEDLARLAGLVVHWVPTAGMTARAVTGVGERWRQEVWVQVRAARADSLRRMGHLDLAEKLFEDLRSLLLHGAIDAPALLAEAAEGEAALAVCRGRHDGAVSLLLRAADLRRQAEDRAAMARCLAAAGELLRSRGEVAEAVTAYAWAARVLEPAALAVERRAALLGLGHAHCDAGDRQAAVEVAADLEALEETAAGTSPGGEGEPATADLQALAGRVWAVRGDDEKARELLTAARERLEGADRPWDRLLVTLDGVAVCDGGGERQALAAELTAELAALEGAGPLAALLDRHRREIDAGRLGHRLAGRLARALLAQRWLES